MHLAVPTAANAFLFLFPLKATTKSFSAGKSLITRLKLARSRAFAGAVNSPVKGLGIVLWAGASLVLLFSVLLYRFLLGRPIPICPLLFLMSPARTKVLCLLTSQLLRLLFSHSDFPPQLCLMFLLLMSPSVADFKKLINPMLSKVKLGSGPSQNRVLAVSLCKSNKLCLSDADLDRVVTAVSSPSLS